jgi:hypothetical protein
LYSPRWSPDEKQILGLDVNSGALRVSDSVTAEWRSLGEQPFGYPKWSGDGKSIYGDAGPAGTVDAVRIKVATRRSEEIARTDFKPNGVIGYGKWLGLDRGLGATNHPRPQFDTDLSHRPGRLNLKAYFCV